MAQQEELIDLLQKSSYLDEMISYFRDTKDPFPLQYLLDDPSYADILVNKFFYPDRESLIHDISDFDLLDKRIEEVMGHLDLWMNCSRHSKMHTINKICFLFVFSGHCICHSENRLIHLNAGDTCVIPAGVPFSHEGLREDCLLIRLLISPNYMQRTLTGKLPQAGTVPIMFFQSMLDTQKKSVQVIRNPNTDISRIYLLHALYEHRYKKLYYHEVLDSYIVLFITEQLRALTANLELNHYTRTSEDKRIIDIRRYIDENYGSVTLTSAAAHFHFTPSYLSHFVHKTTGMTFTQLIQETRLQHAARLLLHSTMTVTEIVSAVGYQNASFFYRIFGEKYGCTPSEYREKNYGLDSGSPITDNTLPPLAKT